MAQEVRLDRVLGALHDVEVAHRDRVDIAGEASGSAELGGLVSEVIVACGKVEVEDLPCTSFNSVCSREKVLREVRRTAVMRPCVPWAPLL